MSNGQTAENRPRERRFSFTDGKQAVIFQPAGKRRFPVPFTAIRTLSSQALMRGDGKLLEVAMPTKRGSRTSVVRADGSITRHELAIRMLVNSHPDIHRNGFNAAIRALWAELLAEFETLDEDPPRIAFLPDAYRIDREASDILIYEVEDSHPIPPKKLYELAMWWFYWECDGEHDWLPRVFTVDRYGKLGTELDLMGLYHAFLD